MPKSPHPKTRGPYWHNTYFVRIEEDVAKTLRGFQQYNMRLLQNNSGASGAYSCVSVRA